MNIPRPLAELVAQFERLPGIGPRSAQRLAYHVLRMTDDDVRRLADSLRAAKENLRLCSVCQSFSEAERCPFCSDSKRVESVICVVAEPKDASAIDRTNEYRGQFHILHGLLNPIDGIGPDQLKIRELLARLSDKVEEVILATNPTVEGDATALYLARVLKPLGVKVTRLAHGMPVGGELDYADALTLARSLEYRREI